jgi:hypothetical protein
MQVDVEALGACASACEMCTRSYVTRLDPDQLPNTMAIHIIRVDRQSVTWNTAYLRALIQVDSICLQVL